MALEPEEILQALDPEQAEAASSVLGPTVILAGAGTGKTRTITHRIAYGIVRGDFSENRVLALTYTNRAAGELRARLRSLGVASANAKTFHSAALAQLEYFFRTLYGIQPFRVQESKAKTLLQAANSLKISLDPNALRDLAAEIEWRKYSLLSLEEYAEKLKIEACRNRFRPIDYLICTRPMTKQTSKRKRWTGKMSSCSALECFGLSHEH